MKFAGGIDAKYKRSVEDAIATIMERGNDLHRLMMRTLVDSDLLINVRPVRKINASGVTGLINPMATNLRMMRDRLSLRDALAQIHITIAEETIDTGGQRGCEGTLVHEGRHAYDFALTLRSFSDSDISPLGIYNPTLYELELEAHKAAGDYMLSIGSQEYIDEGLQLMILRLGEDGSCFVCDEGIKCRLRDSYGLAPDGDQGKLATEMMGIHV